MSILHCPAYYYQTRNEPKNAHYGLWRILSTWSLFLQFAPRHHCLTKGNCIVAYLCLRFRGFIHQDLFCIMTGNASLVWSMICLLSLKLWRKGNPLKKSPVWIVEANLEAAQRSDGSISCSVFSPLDFMFPFKVLSWFRNFAVCFLSCLEIYIETNCWCWNTNLFCVH